MTQGPPNEFFPGVRPVSSHGAEGNWNAQAIFDNTTIRGR
jgi:hypothetical protein